MGNYLKNILFNIIIFLSPTADYYSKEGFCILENPYQHQIGMLRFKSPEEVHRKCKGTVIFRFKEEKCRKFHTYGMKFPIIIIGEKNSYVLEPNREITVCGKTIIEKVKLK